jgi:PAS domain S-box-containing protein
MKNRSPEKAASAPAPRAGLRAEVERLNREVFDLRRELEPCQDIRRYWSHLMQTIPLQIIVVDRTEKVIYINRRFASIAPQDLTGTQIFDNIPQKEGALLRAMLEDVFAAGRIREEEIRLRLADKSIRWIHTQLSPIEKDGAVHEVLVINRDITARKTAEAALLESEQKFRTLAEQSPNMIFINRKGRVVYVNESCEEIMGYGREEFHAPDFDFLGLIVPEDRPLLMESFERHMQGEDIPPYEYSMITRQGERLEAIITTKLIDYAGEPAILGIVTDITERKRAEEALARAHRDMELRVQARTRELTEINRRLQKEIEERKRAQAALHEGEAKLRSILESSPDAITVLDTSGNVLDNNRAALKQFGYSSKKDVLGRNGFDWVVEEDRARGLRNMEIALRKGSLENIEYRMIRKDGSVFPAESSVAVIQGSRGEISGFVVVTKDISDRKASEEALIESQAKLRKQTQALEQKNIALREIIAQVEVEKNKIKDDIAANVQQVVFPILERMNDQGSNRSYLNLLRHHLAGLTSPYGSRLVSMTTRLTPRELEICSFIKAGFDAKKISGLLKISPATVERHRKNIRKKLNLTNTGTNLATFLKALE